MQLPEGSFHLFFKHLSVPIETVVVNTYACHLFSWTSPKGKEIIKSPLTSFIPLLSSIGISIITAMYHINLHHVRY